MKNVSGLLIFLSHIFLSAGRNDDRSPYSGSPEAEAALQQVLKKHARRIQLMNVRSLPGKAEVDAFFHLSLRNVKKQSDFIRELRELEFVPAVNLFFEEDDNGTPGV